VEEGENGSLSYLLRTLGQTCVGEGEASEATPPERSHTSPWHPILIGRYAIQNYEEDRNSVSPAFFSTIAEDSYLWSSAGFTPRMTLAIH